MSNLIFNYPLDLTAQAATNRVVAEEYLIGSIRGRMFVPRGGPFYGNATSLVDLETNRTLVPREDYYLVHYYEEASDRADQPVYAVVRIVNPTVSTRIALTTQYVGGEFSYSYYAIAEAVRTLETDGRPVNWGSLVGVPSEFNPSPHLHDIRNSYNWNSVVDALARIETAILQGNHASMKMLIDTLEAKLLIMDQFRDDTAAIINQFRIDVDNRFAAYDVTVNQYFDTFRSNLKTYLRPTAIKSTSFVASVNRTYTVFPANAANATWNMTLTIPSATAPEDGDYIELYPSRDGCTLSLNAVNAPIRYINQGTMVTENTVNGISLDRSGVKLIWDSRVAVWNLSRSIDPKTAPMDSYDLVELSTSGQLDLKQANSFILLAGNNRMVTFTNTPVNRTKPIAIKVMGIGTVIWPQITWSNGLSPILTSPVTLVTLMYIGGQWMGSWSEMV